MKFLPSPFVKTKIGYFMFCLQDFPNFNMTITPSVDDWTFPLVPGGYYPLRVSSLLLWETTQGALL